MKSSRQPQKTYVLQDEESINTLFLELQEYFSLAETKRSQKVNETYYDTFEWNLFANKLLLKKRGKTFYLHTKNNEDVVEGNGLNRKHFFYWDLNPGELRKNLRQFADIRALSNIVMVKNSRRKVDLLNKDGKIVARLFVDQGVASGNNTENEICPIIHLLPIRGYEKAYTSLDNVVNALQFKQIKDEAAYLQMALSAIGKEVLDYSSKFHVDLDEDTTIHQTVKKICLYLVNAMARNIQGVMEDIDSEFLHDYRIAIRRTRSLISQMKKVIPAEEIIAYQNEFRWLGSITGPVRDIDVYLLMKDEYRSMLTEQLHDGLDEFFFDLELSRKGKLQEMRKGLLSHRYTELLENWYQFLTMEDGVTWHMGEKICKPYALKMIRKRLKRILRDGGAITAQTPDEELHKLRIQGKKLRYMLEFFRSFFNAEDIEYFLKQLKKLQNNLGDFNDVSVQLEMLINYKQELTGRTKRSINIAAAVGGLVTHLASQHKQIRQKFESTFSEFSCEENIAKFNEMLA